MPESGHQLQRLQKMIAGSSKVDAAERTFSAADRFSAQSNMSGTAHRADHRGLRFLWRTGIPTAVHQNSPPRRTSRRLQFKHLQAAYTADGANPAPTPL